MHDAGCDPAFDAVYDDLEREFTERRMHNFDAWEAGHESQHHRDRLPP